MKGKRARGFFLLGISLALLITRFSLTGAVIGSSEAINWLGFVSFFTAIIGLVIILNENLEGKLKENIPNGIFYAPEYYIERDKNHDNQGYHCHIYLSKNHKRTNVRICYDGHAIYVEKHGSGIPVDLEKVSKYINKHLKEEVILLLGKFEIKNLARPTRKAIKI